MQKARLFASGKFLVLIVATISTLAFLASPPQAMAVNVVMTFDSTDSEYPAYDLDGSKLTALMANVETYYEDVFESSGTLNVEFYYEDIDVLAVHNNLSTDGLWGKPTSCRIRVDTNRTWFLDETPFNDSEYNMVQTLAGSVANLSTKYDGTVPDLLEYSYKGSNNGSGPTESSTGYDLWSVLLHEMGHGMGLTSNVSKWESYWDDDYDFDSTLVWGNSIAADVYASDNRYHLAAETNMYPYFSAGQRTLPSATDIFAIETAAEWGDTGIDLMRKDFYSSDANANLNTRGNWAGNMAPDSTEDASIRDGGAATLSADMTVNNLVMGGDTTVYTSTYKLRADQNCTIGDAGGYGSVVISNGGEFQVDGQIVMESSSQIRIYSGAVLDADSLDMKAGSRIIGSGTIEINSGLSNWGIIHAYDGDLTITSNANVDLDGDNGGQILVTGGNFSCNKALTDTFNGHVQIDSGRTATFTGGWTHAGTLDLNGGITTATRAKIAGGLFRLAATTDVDKGCEIACDMWVEAATVTLADSDDNLYIASGTETTIFSTATFTGAGRVYGLSGSSIILKDDTVIDVRFRAHGDLTIEEGSIGTATVDGVPFALGSTGTFLVEVSGDDVCDLLDVNGTAYLDGTLEIDFIGKYAPADGDSFTVLEYTSRSGTFDDITWTSTSFDLIPFYGKNNLTLTVDYGDSANEAVPEPSTWILLISAACCFGFFRRKKR